MQTGFKMWVVAGSWSIIILLVVGILVYARHRTTIDEETCTQAAPASFKADRKTIVESLKTVAEHSNDLSNWGILLIAGSIAMVVGTSYLRPPERSVRLAYLLFPPAWLLLAVSILAGRSAKGSYLASTIVGERYLFGTVACANAALSRQIDFLFWAVAGLSIWLIVFLNWWIFSPHEERK